MREQTLSIMVNVLPKNGDIGKCFAASLQDGTPVVAILESTLSDLGLQLSYRQGKAGFWAEITDGERGIIARGYDKTAQEALLQAVYGALREGR